MSEFKSKLEEFSYALGLSIAGNLMQSGVSQLSAASFTEALNDAFEGNKPKINPSVANQILQNYMEDQQAEAGEGNKAAGVQFLAENKTKEGVIETASGLQYKILKTGTGKCPRPTDKVKCHYHGTLIDGTVFDSSVQRNQPATFPVNGVIQGWVEALQMMPVGSKWQLYIPSDLAYGSRGAGGSIGPNTALIFDVELLDIV